MSERIKLAVTVLALLTVTWGGAFVLAKHVPAPKYPCAVHKNVYSCERGKL